MKTKTLTDIKKMIKVAREFFPSSKNMQRQWVLKTKHLIDSNKHVLFGAEVKWATSTGKFKIQ